MLSGGIFGKGKMMKGCKSMMDNNKGNDQNHDEHHMKQ